jgi:hypothetical protein
MSTGSKSTLRIPGSRDPIQTASNERDTSP